MPAIFFVGEEYDSLPTPNLQARRKRVPLVMRRSAHCELIRYRPSHLFRLNRYLYVVQTPAFVGQSFQPGGGKVQLQVIPSMREAEAQFID